MIPLDDHGDRGGVVIRPSCGGARTGRPRKWATAEPLASLEDLDVAVRRNDLLFYKGRPAAARFVGNLPYGLVRHALLRDEIRRAVVRDEYREWLASELDEVHGPPPPTAGPWREGTGGDTVVSDHPVAGQDEATVSFYGGYLVAESIQRRNRPLIIAAPLLWRALFASHAALVSHPGGDNRAEDDVEAARRALEVSLGVPTVQWLQPVNGRQP